MYVGVDLAAGDSWTVSVEAIVRESHMEGDVHVITKWEVLSVNGKPYHIKMEEDFMVRKGMDSPIEPPYEEDDTIRTEHKEEHVDQRDETQNQEKPDMTTFVRGDIQPEVKK